MKINIWKPYSEKNIFKAKIRDQVMYAEAYRILWNIYNGTFFGDTS